MRDVAGLRELNRRLLDWRPDPPLYLKVDTDFGYWRLTFLLYENPAIYSYYNFPKYRLEYPADILRGKNVEDVIPEIRKACKLPESTVIFFNENAY